MEDTISSQIDNIWSYFDVVNELNLCDEEIEEVAGVSVKEYCLEADALLTIEYLMSNMCSEEKCNEYIEYMENLGEVD